MRRLMFFVSETVRFVFLANMAALGIYAAFRPDGAAFPLMMSSAILLFLLFAACSLIPHDRRSGAEKQTGFHAIFATLAALGMLLITFNHPDLRRIFFFFLWMNVASALAVLVYMVFGITEFVAALRLPGPAR